MFDIRSRASDPLKDNGASARPGDKVATPALAPMGSGRYGVSPLQRRDAPSRNGITAAENDAVRELSHGRVDLHGLAARMERVPADDSRLAGVAARSYTQGRHALIGNESDRGHELWHLAQQAMGRVQVDSSLDGHPLNTNPGLEHEADRYGTMISDRASAEPMAASVPSLD